MEQEVSLKATLKFEDLSCRVNITKHDNYAGVRSKLIQSFPLLRVLEDKAEIKIKWQDEDGDWMRLSSDEDLKNAIVAVPNGKLKVQISVDIKEDIPSSEVRHPTIPAAQHNLRKSTPDDLDLLTHVKGQPVSLESTEQRSREEEDKGQPGSLDSIGQQPVDESPPSNTSDQYDGMYSSFTSTSSHQWPNEETCSLSRIQQVTLQRQPSVPRDNAYPISVPTRKNRGRVVIINNKRFDTLCPLNGTDTDSTCISEVFRRLNYSVKPYSNKTGKEIGMVLNDEYKHLAECGDRYDMFILILLTRCEDNYVYGRDGNRDLQFWQILEGFNCLPNFNGKPKIIIAEGCSKGSYTTSSELQPADILQKVLNPSGYPINVQGDLLTTNRSVSVDETDAQAYSPEIRDTFFYCGYTYGSGAPFVKGSLMLQALKDALLNSAGDCSLQQMIPLAEEMMKSAPKSSEDFTMPTIVRDTLEKNVYFI